MSGFDRPQYQKAYAAIKAEAETNKGEVAKIAEGIMLTLADKFPMSITTMAALYSLAISGAAVVARYAPEEEEDGGEAEVFGSNQSGAAEGD